MNLKKDGNWTLYYIFSI